MAQTLELIPLLEPIPALEPAKLLVPTPRGKSARSGIVVNPEHTQNILRSRLQGGIGLSSN